MKNSLVKIYLLISVLLLSELSFSQQAISLHPYIGDTITSREAFDFYLFQDSTIGKYDYAIISMENENRYRVRFYGDTISEIFVDSSQVAHYAQNIEKVYQYLSRNNDEKEMFVGADSLFIQPVELYLMTPESKKKMVREARVYNQKRLRADEKCLFGSEREDYINCSGLYIWTIQKKPDKK
jgi:hypothetical protein